jgi:hypothetical protein
MGAVAGVTCLFGCQIEAVAEVLNGSWNCACQGAGEPFGGVFDCFTVARNVPVPFMLFRAFTGKRIALISNGNCGGRQKPPLLSIFCISF